jgi:hypothetical protein
MKKIIISISGLLMLAFVVILFVNAQNSPGDKKKASTEVSVNCGKCPSAAVSEKMCPQSASCDPAKCKEAKCDPATCKANCAAAKCKNQTSTTSGCVPLCPMKKGVK